jgi:hypothetical protein
VLCAASDFHIAYSTTALTDVMLGLWLVLAVQAAGLSLWKGDLRWAIAAGFFTGLAWWTKYNGWLPLAIEAAGIGLMFVAWIGRFGSAGASPSRATPSLWFLCLAGTTLTAAGMWAPYYLSLQPTGGYGPIAANHAQYVVGLAGWPDCVSRHVAAQHVMEGWLSALGLGAAAMVAAFVGRRPLPNWKRVLVVAIIAFGLAGLARVGTSFLLVTAAAAVGIVLAWRHLLRLDPRNDDFRRSLVGLSLLAAWWCGLAVATPCYWPYPRLLVPWLLASWLLAAVSFDVLLASWLAEASQRASLRELSFATIVLAAAAIGGWILRPAWPDQYARDRRSFQAVARQVQGQTAINTKAVLYVHGEPALLFQLRSAGEPLAVPLQNIPAEPATENGRPLPTYLLLGPHSSGDSSFQRDWLASRESWELIDIYPVTLSPIVSLDLFDPRQPLSAEQQKQLRVELHRMRETGQQSP